MGGIGVVGRIILKWNDCLRVETEFILLRIWISGRLLCSTKNIGFHKIQDYFYECETFVDQEVLCSILLAQYFRTKQTNIPAALYCTIKLLPVLK
jgi:hypothetical protein